MRSPLRSVISICIISILLAWPMRARLQSDSEPYTPQQTYMVTNLNSSGAGSLQQAIMDANANQGLDTINFNVLGSGIQFLFVNATLPTITDPVVIDGTTQPGYSGTPLIHLEGMGTGQAFNVTGGGTTIRGFSFTSFFAGSNGIIKLSGGGNNVIAGCSFGVRGDSSRPTTASIGVLIDASDNNRVGGPAAADRNYFAVSNEQSFVIQNGASGNQVAGNWFGTGPNGTRMSTIGRDAIRILNSPNNVIGGASGTTPGGACTGECNVIGGAGNNAIFINGTAASGNRVTGNFVGLFPNGTSVNQNNIGIRIENAPGNIVGGNTAGQRNVITGNDGLAGVLVTGAASSGTVISGNYIGLYSNGISTPPAAAVSLDGVLVNGGAAKTRIGGVTAGERNVISGLRTNGIELAGANGSTVQGNYIGTDSSGMARSTTLGNGVRILLSNDNIIGGTTNTTLGGACTGACNVISGNGNDGAGDGISLSTANGNMIDGNYVGVNAAGTGPMLNGITPNGATFTGNAVRLFNSSNNILGRLPDQPGPTRSEGPGPVCVAATNYYGLSWYSPDAQSSVTTGRHCQSGTTYQASGRLEISGAIVHQYNPTSYEPPPPVDDGVTGSLVVNTNSWSGGFNYFAPSAAPELYAPLVFSTYQPQTSNNCGSCPTDGVGLYNGSIRLGGDQGSNFNEMLGLEIGLKTHGIYSLQETNNYTALIVEQGPSHDNKFDECQIISPEGPAIVSTGGTLQVGDFAVVADADQPMDLGTTVQYVDFELEKTADRRMRLHGTISGAPPNVELITSLVGVKHLVSPYVDIPDEALISAAALYIISQTDLGGEVSLDWEFEDDEVEYIEELEAIRVISTIGGYPYGLSNSITVPHAPYDVDRDGKTDISVVRAEGPGSPSIWYTDFSSDGSFHFQQFGLGGDLLAPADYSGNNADDLGLWRMKTGTWYFSKPGGDPSVNFDAVQWGSQGDIPYGGGDYDGDRRPDLAMYRPVDRLWFIRLTLRPDPIVRAWGLDSDKRVPADYDGNGTTDLAIWRSGLWAISQCVTCSPRYENFGLSTDIPVPADYDGDGKTDIAVWRPESGIWYINGSRTGFAAYQWGLKGDKPLYGDYDGDGKGDVSVFRPSEGIWYIRGSRNGGALIRQFGQDGDKPITSFEAKYHF